MRKIAATLLMLLFAVPAASQEGPGQRELVDRVVAVVGDTVLLMSDLQQEVLQLQAAQRLPDDDETRAALLQQVLDTRLDELILYTAAKRSGVEIREEDIQAQADMHIESARQPFGSEQEFYAALAAEGLSPEQYRQLVLQQLRKPAVVQTYLQQRLRDAPRPQVTDAEIQEFYEAHRDAIGSRPATVTLQQVLIEVEASDESRAAARARAQEVLEELRDGGTFEVLARRYSDDPGSREQGGDLGWFRRGRMVPEFEDVVYRMRPGQTSGIVSTDFGYHIIRVERARGTERQARHILISPEISSEDAQRAWERADSIANAAREGASFTDLIRRYPTPGENRVERFPLDRLPPVYSQVLETASPGDIVGPFEDRLPTGARYVVVRLQERGEPGEATLDDVRAQIRQEIEQQKMVERLVADLRRSTYVSVMW
jgi:peptidyl-prolyl cis-trans isomerase SurA